MIDFGFDLAGTRDARLTRGGILGALGAAVDGAMWLGTAWLFERVLHGALPVGAPTKAFAALALLTALAIVLKRQAGLDNFISTYHLVGAMRLRLLEHLRRLPMGFWNTQRTGVISTVLTDEFSLYSDVVTHTWGIMVANAALPVVLAGGLFWLDWRVALAAVSTLPLAFMAVPWSYRLLDGAADKLRTVRERTMAQMVEYIQGVQTLRALGRTAEANARLKTQLGAFERELMRFELAPAPAILAYGLCVFTGFGVLLLVGGWLVGRGELDLVRLVAMALLGARMAVATSELALYLAQARFAAATLSRMRGMFETPVQSNITNASGADVLTAGDIAAEDVHFAYGDTPTLRGVTATLPHGQTTALVGPSGSGKSTFAHLLARLWDVDAGAITVNGVDTRTVPLSALHNHVALVLQDVVLFSDSVADNIRLARPDASDDEVIAAAKAAEAHDFIAALPDGYDTMLGEGGADLSGGQRQRLSIARALLRDAPVLILDEPTSSVDACSEQALQRALSRVTAGRTVVVIAHKLWTVQNAAQILVFDEGDIVERGTHDTLLAAEGTYADLWRAQQAV